MNQMNKYKITIFQNASDGKRCLGMPEEIDFLEPKRKSSTYILNTLRLSSKSISHYKIVGSLLKKKLILKISQSLFRHSFLSTLNNKRKIISEWGLEEKVSYQLHILS